MRGLTGRRRPLMVTGLLPVLFLLASPVLIDPGARAQTAGDATAKFDPSRSDEMAITIADKVAKAMGGSETWDKAAFIKFTFVMLQGELRLAERTHYWDKASGRSRMEGPSKDKKNVIAIVDHATKSGQAAIDGQLLLDDDAKKFIELAYSNLVYDSYWAFMQFRLKEPGVRLRYEGEIKAGPVTYDKILVTFDDSGLTPGDRYWLYINRDTSKVERWSYVLRGQGSSASPTAWQWVDWTEAKGLSYAMRKTQADGEIDIVIENVAIYDSLPETVFTSTAPLQDEATASASGR